MTTSSPYWMVLGEGRPTVKHSTEQVARAEAERLSKANPGKTFVVLKGVAEYRKKPDPVDVVELQPEQRPNYRYMRPYPFIDWSRY